MSTTLRRIGSFKNIYLADFNLGRNKTQKFDRLASFGGNCYRLQAKNSFS